MPDSLPPPSSAEGIFNVDLRGVHYDFLKDRVPAWFNQSAAQRQQELADHEMELPSWYLSATAQSRSELAASHIRYRDALNRVENTLGTIKDVLDFAEQPLKDALKQQFNLDLDVRQVYLVRKYAFKGRDDLYGFLVFDQQNDGSLSYEYRGVSLLEAALANFEADEEQPLPCTDCQLITTWSGYDGEVLSTFHAVNAQAVSLAPHAFARLCRTLDLGEQYQQHLKAIVQPEDGAERDALEKQLEEYHRQSLALGSEIARRQYTGSLTNGRTGWGISDTAYRMLQQVVADPASATLDGKPVAFAALQVFGCTLVGPVLIGPNRLDSERVERLVVYIPNDPQQPVKEYGSSADFMVDLRTRLHSASYRRFFSSFVPQREQGVFFKQFDALYKPSNGAAADYPIKPRAARLPLAQMEISGNLWEQLRQAQVRKILADGRAVAVPTGDEDRNARLERLSSYLDAVISVYNLAAFVVPGLGPIMLAVGAAQMASEAFEGIEAYEQGDVKSMWAHFSSVALNAAFIGTGSKVLPQVKVSSMVDNLRPITQPDGQSQLWNPDMGAYKIPVDLGADAKPDRLGLYQHKGETILPHEGDYYRVKQEARTGDYRIQHPSRPEAYTPLLEHNHAGAWSHEVEEPLTWDTPTLMRRLGLTREPLSAERLEHARDASGVGVDALRETFVEHQPVPVLLNQSIERFKLHQQLTTFIEQMRSSDPAIYAKADIALQMHILRRRGLLPQEPPLRVLDRHGTLLWEDDARPSLAKRVVVLSEQHIARGELLEEVLNTLQGVDPALKGIPGTGEDSLQTRAGLLRQDIAGVVETFKGALLEERYNALSTSDDPDVRLIRDSYPHLPEPVAAQLLKRLDTPALEALRDTGRLPPESAELAQWCEQETRVAKAYEGLHLDTLADIDSQRLALRTLETLPGWPRGTRVELRRYSAAGPLLDAIGSPDWPHTRVLVQMDNGLFQAPAPRDFYAGAWDALSGPERQGLGFTDAQQLKAAIQHTPLPREPLRTVLLEHPVRKPAYDPAMRLLGGGRGILQRVSGALRSSSSRMQDRVKALYPSFDDAEVARFIQGLGDDAGGKLDQLKAQYKRLDETLKEWVKVNEQPTSSEVARAQDPAVSIANTIRRCWRRESEASLHLFGTGTLELPAVDADFSHVQTLELHRFAWSDTAHRFLAGFGQLRGLRIDDCGLTELPEAVGDMRHLTSLDLSGKSSRFNRVNRGRISGNRLQLTRQSAAKLSAMVQLEDLSLANNPLGSVPDFSGMRGLKKLNLRNTGIDQWPAGLSSQEGLERVDLSQNQLREVPEQHLRPAPDRLDKIARINGVTLLRDNAFPAEYWRELDSYWQRLSETRPDLIKGALSDAFDSGNPDVEKYRRVYPGKSSQQAREFLWRSGADAGAELTRLEQEFNVLQNQLSAWVFSGGGERQRYVRMGERQANTAAMTDRYTAQQRILECWRRESAPKLANDGTPIGLELDLSGLNLPSLPDLDVDFSHVGSLKLNNMHLSASPEGFLARYRHLRWLDMSNNQLRELPPALGDMHGLTRLMLQKNQIRLTAQTARILSERTTLRALLMHDNPLSISPDFSRITDLRTLSLARTQIDTWPVGLAEQPALDTIDLQDNQITSIPAAVIAPPAEQLEQMTRINRVTRVNNNPLSAETQQRVLDYAARLRQAGPSGAGEINLLVDSARQVRGGRVITAAQETPFLRWTSNLSAEQIAARRTQWFALRDQPGADGLFNSVLERLDLAGADRGEQQRRVWEMLDAISENTPQSAQLRQELFDRAGEPRCCDRAAFTFSNLEVQVLVHRARGQALDEAPGRALSQLSRGLFRLHEIDKIASADIQRSEAIVNDPAVSLAEKQPHRSRLNEEVEIRLAYRHGLKDRLQLPGQPDHVRFTGMVGVTAPMLDAAYEKVVALNNSAQEFQSLVSEDFWQDYLAHKYRPQFEAQSQPHQEALVTLTDRFNAGDLTEGMYKQKADDEQARLAVKEAALIETLSRQELAEHPLDGESSEEEATDL
ncbi:NEL-type E3 ubiquitin ligase domain-containing protein [Pseudomonas sp. 44 R 15]|uniref:NEL-type E3 ubiquitin ligase domain-containing protein n=1 Tax=Pseudomonas sp. 44 R 15 TaxID=1844105 RepID=UPI000811F559|nr:NEL-type E3 ubiquitin ligase domain-containing protein [Pseudomonas sp. 44 R 15]CRM65332.1 putative E3 ubiquitin-protein ligase ipaH7.8 [Pseudomonas sp. 44 R 15]